MVVTDTDEKNRPAFEVIWNLDTGQGDKLPRELILNHVVCTSATIQHDQPAISIELIKHNMPLPDRQKTKLINNT